MSNIARRKDLGLGATAGGGSGGSYAAHGREAGSPPAPSVFDLESGSDLQPQRSDSADRLAAFLTVTGRSDTDWINENLKRDGAVRQSDWRLAMRRAWQEHDAEVAGTQHRFPGIRNFMVGSYIGSGLQEECRRFAAETKKTDDCYGLAKVCGQYARHGKKKHEDDIPIALRADDLVTELSRGGGLDEIEMQRVRHLSEAALADATLGHLSENEEAGLGSLSDTLEDCNFHSESVAIDAIRAIDLSRKSPEDKISEKAAWAMAASRVEVPQDLVDRAKSEHPAEHGRGVEWREQHRAPFAF